MVITYWEHKVGISTYLIKEWKCCGHLWQLMLSGNYIRGHNWNPVCPTCGKKSESVWLPGKRYVP